MPKQGDFDTTYPDKLKQLKISLLEPFNGAKKPHRMKCDICNHEWIATPISKLQNFKKWNNGGCPECNKNDRTAERQVVRQQNLEKLKARGLEVLTPNYDGRWTLAIKKSTSIRVKIRNIKCGHIFETASKNLLSRNVTCPICARELKTKNLNDSTKARSIEYHKTADLWDSYRHKVYMATRVTYYHHKTKINPTDLPRGKAGQEGAYHLDHLVPVRWCFEHYVPVDVCAHHTNLQMLHWNDNIGSRDKLKENVQIPLIFHPYISPLDK